MGIGAWRFPEWFVVQEEGGGEERERSRRLVHRKALDDKGRFDGRAGRRHSFRARLPEGTRRRPRLASLRRTAPRTTAGGSSGSTSAARAATSPTSSCAASAASRAACTRPSVIELNPLGTCRGARPWLGRNSNEDCKLPSRLLIRTASNAYFPQVVSVLSLPDRGTAVETAVRRALGRPADRRRRRRPRLPQEEAARSPTKLAAFSDEEVLEAIRADQER